MIRAFDLLYADAHLVVLDKPPRVAIHRSDLVRHGPFLVPILRRQLGQRVWPVHRLDRPTRGALVVALSAEGHKALQAQFAERSVRKTYEAIVRGWPAAESWAVDRPLAPPEGGEARAARTRFERRGTATLPIPLGRFPSVRYAWIEARPETGRFHQIRRHLNKISHPVVGDVRHGDRHHNHLWIEHHGVDELMLVARRLRFTHPVTGAEIDVVAPRGPQFERALAVLGLGEGVGPAERAPGG